MPEIFCDAEGSEYPNILENNGVTDQRAISGKQVLTGNDLKILQFSIRFERLLTSIATVFIDTELDAFDREIFIALGKIGRILGITRCYIVQSGPDGKRLEKTCEWSAANPGPKTYAFDSYLSTLGYAGLKHILETRKMFYVPDVLNMSGLFGLDPVPFQKYGLEIFLAVSLCMGKKCNGYLIVEFLESPRMWAKDICNNFSCIADIFSNALQRKHDTFEIKKREDHFRMVADYTYAWEYLIEADGKISYMSPSCKRVSGYARQEFIKNNRLLADIIHPDDKHIFLKNCSQNFHDNNISTHNLRIINKQGYTRWVTIICQPVFDCNGNFLGKRVSVRDITREVIAEEMLEEQKNRVQKYLEVADVILIIFDTEYKISLINRKGYDLLGYSKGELIGANFLEVIFELEDYQKLKRKINRLIRGEIKSQHIETEVHTKSGKKRMIEWHNIALKDTGGNIIAVLGSGGDITDVKNANRRLFKINECFLNYGSDPIKNIHRLLSVCCEITRSSYATYNRLTNGFLDIVCGWNLPEGYVSLSELERKICHNSIKIGRDLTVLRNFQGSSRLAGGASGCKLVPKTYISKAVKFGGSYMGAIWVAFAKDYVPTAHDKWLLEVIASAIGVEEKRKFATDALVVAEKKYRSIFENSIEGIFQVDSKQTFINLNNACARILGYTGIDHLLSEVKNAQELFVDPNERQNFIAILEKKGMVSNYETRFYRRDRSIIWVSLFCRLICHENDTCLLEGTVMDISERKRAEKELRASLAEKEILLNEVHHRVKNNLQIVSSLLDLAGMRASSAEAKSLSDNARSQIQAMAFIHSQLYCGNNLNTIDMSEYIMQLCDYLAKIFNTFDEKIFITFDLSTVYLSLEKAVPCGLALNEALSNVFKHAFADAKEGTVLITMKKSIDNIVRISIKDDGSGLPDNFDIEKTNSIGVKLMKNLVRDQLFGILRVDSRTKGTRVSFEF
ncbi:MAG: PAS domain S-box protein [Desulfoplanes sp.]